MPPKSIHWKVPATMFGAWIAGILLIFGHHTLNQGLHGKPISDISIEQKINTFAGTALAFMVKTCFALAASTAYIQIIWNTAKRNETRMGTLDSAFNAVKDVSALSDFSLWTTFPMVTFLALSLTLLPIPSVITPASIILASVQNNTSLFRHVPCVDFTSLNFANIYFSIANYKYGGPQYAVQQVVTTSLTRGDILPIQPVGLNTSWSLNFSGPAIDCSAVTRTELANITANIKEFLYKSCGQNDALYISWVADASGFTPFRRDSVNSSYTARAYPPSQPAPGQLRTFFALFPEMSPTDIPNKGCSPYWYEIAMRNATVISCGLYNTTYQTSFSYLGGIQTIVSTIGERLNDVYAAPQIWIKTMEFNKTTIQNYAYQSVWDAFSSVFVGMIHLNMDVDAYGTFTVDRTSIMTSVLSRTNETAFLETTTSEGSESGQTLQGTIGDDHGGWAGASITHVPGTNLPGFAATLEEVFKNVTMSLMSSALLQPDFTKKYAPPMTNVTTHLWVTVYVYSPRLLWIPYGIATLLASIAVSLGALALFSNGVSYSANFSTMIRISQETKLSEPVREADVDGRDPLPKYLAKSRVSFSARSGMGEDTAYIRLNEMTK